MQTEIELKEEVGKVMATSSAKRCELEFVFTSAH